MSECRKLPGVVTIQPRLPLTARLIVTITFAIANFAILAYSMLPVDPLLPLQSGQFDEPD